MSLLTDFAAFGSTIGHWKMVDFNAPHGEGDSGGPIFNASGRVVAVHAWGRVDVERRKRTGAGIRIDGLWDLLDHYGLKRLVTSEGN